MNKEFKEELKKGAPTEKEQVKFIRGKSVGKKAEDLYTQKLEKTRGKLANHIGKTRSATNNKGEER